MISVVTVTCQILTWIQIETIIKVIINGVQLCNDYSSGSVTHKSFQHIMFYLTKISVGISRIELHCITITMLIPNQPNCVYVMFENSGPS